MPLIRYVTGDRAVAADRPCPCGRGLACLERIEGRVIDYLLVPGHGRRSLYELTTAISEVPGVLQYKVFQRAENKLEVLVVLAGQGKTTTALAVERAVRKVLYDQFDVTVTTVGAIAREPSGKRRPVELLQTVEAAA